MTISTAVQRLINNVKIEVPNVGDDVIQLMMFNALKEFLTDSRMWKQDITVTTAVDDDTYTLTPTASTGAIIELFSVTGASDQNVPATMEVPGTLVLNTDPSAVEALTVKVILTAETIDADNIPVMPTGFMTKYEQGLTHGVIGGLMSQPAKPWTNERLAVWHNRKFRNAIATARSEAQHQNLHDGQRWTYPRFAMGSQR
jgi:hypothetical protein